MNTTAVTIAEEILDLFARYGDEAYGEDLSQREHMIQSAQLAQAEGQPEEVVLAAFLHDIGHLYGHEIAAGRMGDYGAQDHEALGAAYLLQRGFSPAIAALVEGHVLAKRYLCFAEPDYYAQLSHASRETLRQQGGPMEADEARRFEQSAHFALSIRMRHWDEEAKITGMPPASLEPYRDMIIRHLNR